MGREPAAGAEAGGRKKGRGSNLRRGFIKEERKKVDVKRQEERGKGEGEVGAGCLSHSLSYTKVPSVPVIQETGVGLRAEE